MTTTSSPDQSPDLWIDRVGTRRYVGHSARGGVVQIGGAEAEDTFTPGELLKIALASCSGLSADAALARRLGADFNATIHVGGPKDVAEERYPELVERLEIDLSGLGPEERDRLLTVVRRAIDQSCTVGRTLEAGAAVRLTIESVPTPTDRP